MTLKFFILTGEPGVGKTTLTQKLTSLLSEMGVKMTGFYTEEVRKNRTREGFDIVTLEGQRSPLARDQTLLDFPVKHKVGKYGVLVQEFENLALACFEKGKTEADHLLVIDEIGKMELFSEPFKTLIKNTFGPESSQVVLATIPVRKGDPIVEAIRNNSSGKVWTITRENRNTIHKEILQEMKIALKIR